MVSTIVHPIEHSAHAIHVRRLSRRTSPASCAPWRWCTRGRPADKQLLLPLSLTFTLYLLSFSFYLYLLPLPLPLSLPVPLPVPCPYPHPYLYLYRYPYPHPYLTFAYPCLHLCLCLHLPDGAVHRRWRSRKSLGSGVNRGQREHMDSFRGYPKKGWCGVLSTLVSCCPRYLRDLPLELPPLNTDLYRLPIGAPRGLPRSRQRLWRPRGEAQICMVSFQNFMFVFAA